MKKIKSNINLILPILLFGIIYSLISFGNHYNFRTYAQDLGIFNNALYDYAHFRWNVPSVLHLELSNILADHFLILAFLVAPFTWIFGSYTLLIFQIFSILFGGLGVYKIVNKYSNKTYATLALIHFFSIYGIYSALSFDAHYSVIGTMFVPWLIYYILQKNILGSIIFSFLMLITKENFSIWLFFIGLAFLFTMYKEKKMMLFLSSLMLVSLVYFYTVVSYIMPKMSGLSNSYIHFDYTVLGSSFNEAFAKVITSPMYAIKMFFGNFLENPKYDNLKTETIFAILLSGGILLFKKPQYLLVLFPVLAQRFFNSYFSKWGLFNHYSIEVVPVIVIGFYLVLNEFKIGDSFKKGISILFVLFSFLISILMVRNSDSIKYRCENYEYYSSEHYIRNFDVNVVHSQISKINEDAIVSAQSPLVPHLAMRDKIYEYPNVLDADYIVLLPSEENTYPLKKDLYDQKLKEIRESGIWSISYEDENVLIFRKN